MLTIGIDDTDSERGLCTTYLAAVLMERLRPFGTIAGLPRLVRLNPCARYKTRGNAAIAVTIETERPDEAKETAIKTLLELSDIQGKNTNPGLVIAEEVTPSMRTFYRRALTEILEIREAREILDSEEIWHLGLKKGRGLIGALAAAAATLDDRTYELIAYRERRRWGTPRVLDAESVWRADAATYPSTWDSVDRTNGRIVFSPHSPDPVLFGIRGDDTDAIERAFHAIVSEPPERMVLYVTNQGTDAHILDGDIGSTTDDRSYRLRGRVASVPRTIEGGHVFFTLCSLSGASEIVCAAFEPTKQLRDVVRSLMPGDEIEVLGAVRSGTLNLEKLDILDLTQASNIEPPLCPECGRRMKSAGRRQGYRCRRCRTRAERPVARAIQRDLEPGLYEVPPSARRHLSKPLVRTKDTRAHPSR